MGSYLSGGPTVGQLKTSLSHLEYENAQLKRSVAKLEQENRSIEDRLVREEVENGDLAARLDDARNLLRDRGLDGSDRARASRDGSNGLADDRFGVRALPAGQRSRKRRKPPVARIPGQADDSGSADDESFVPELGTDADRSRPRFDEELDHHTYYPGPLRWAPIAGGAKDSVSQVR
jgi:hypothetical protein